jgi:pyrroloquinoline-quinone synthase
MNFDQVIAERHLLKHPFYQAWMQGTLSRETLQDYARQYFHHVEAFPRYLSSAHSLAENETDRRALLENLADEEGLTYGTSHPELWLRFAEGLGVDRESVKSTVAREGIARVVRTFFRLSRSSLHEALGALYAYESQVPEIAESKIEGLKNRYGHTDERTLSFFEVHRRADVAHREVIRAQLEALPHEKKREALQAARDASVALWDFLSEVHGRSHAACPAH